MSRDEGRYMLRSAVVASAVGSGDAWRVEAVIPEGSKSPHRVRFFFFT